MKKIVILMLALMLALTSVSAMAEGEQKTTNLTLTLTESFEWSVPESLEIKVTANNKIQVQVTALKHFPTNKKVHITVPEGNIQLKGEKDESNIIEVGATFDPMFSYKYADKTSVGSVYLYCNPACTADELALKPADTYTGAITFTASIVSK